jgi:hypothetical protein
MKDLNKKYDKQLSSGSGARGTDKGKFVILPDTKK